MLLVIFNFALPDPNPSQN